MRFATIALVGCLLLGCAGPVVTVIPGFAPHETPVAAEARVPEDCSFTGLVISHAQPSRWTLGSDVQLSERIAELMRREFRRAGARVTRDPGEAYWSLMVLAADDHRHYEGFLFAATLALRQLHEGHDSGLNAYAGDGAAGPPTIYSALGYGPGYALDETVRNFVHRADAALLPALRDLCADEAAERAREAHADSLIPAPLPL
jgi:hypothetical protein